MRLRESNPKERKTVLGHYKNAINIYFCSLTAGGAKACKSIEGVLRRPGQRRRRAEPCGGRHCCPLCPGAANPSAVAFSVQKLERRQCHNTDRHTTHSRQALERAPLARSVQGRRFRCLGMGERSLLQCGGGLRGPHLARAAPYQ